MAKLVASLALHAEVHAAVQTQAYGHHSFYFIPSSSPQNEFKDSAIWHKPKINVL